MQIRDDSALKPILENLSLFRKHWPGRGWSWDTRIGCVSSSFNVDLEPDARSAIALAFKHTYTAKTLGAAPELLQEVVEQSGGLRSDQMALATDQVRGLLVYGLWWPWGDDVTISLRVGLAGRAAGRFEEEFRDFFGALF